MIFISLLFTDDTYLKSEEAVLLIYVLISLGKYLVLDCKINGSFGLCKIGSYSLKSIVFSASKKSL